MKIHITIPTLDREKLLDRTIQSIRNSDYGGMITVWIVVDGNADFYKKVKGKYSGMSIRVLFNTERKDWIYSTNYVIKNFTSDGYVLYSGDDIEFKSDCIRKAFYLHRDKFPDGDGIVGLHQDVRGVNSAFGLMGQKFINRFIDRRVFCPDYIHYGSDTELGIYARSKNLFAYGGDCHVKHSRPHDNTYRVADPLKKRDFALRLKRKEMGLIWGNSFKLIGGK